MARIAARARPAHRRARLPAPRKPVRASPAAPPGRRGGAASGVSLRLTDEGEGEPGFKAY